MPHHPEVHVRLTGRGGQPSDLIKAILADTTRALRKANVPRWEIQLFKQEATSGDYEHLLQTVMQWVSWS